MYNVPSFSISVDGFKREQIIYFTPRRLTSLVLYASPSTLDTAYPHLFIRANTERLLLTMTFSLRVTAFVRICRP